GTPPAGNGNRRVRVSRPGRSDARAVLRDRGAAVFPLECGAFPPLSFLFLRGDQAQYHSPKNGFGVRRFSAAFFGGLGLPPGKKRKERKRRKSAALQNNGPPEALA